MKRSLALFRTFRPLPLISPLLSGGFLSLLLLAGVALPAQAEDISEILRIRGRMHTGWQLLGDERNQSWSDSFYLRRARIDARWTPFDWAKLVLELEFTDGIEAKDVYAELGIWKDLDLDLTLGYFKKPFSRIRLESPWDLLIPERGLLDDQVTRKTPYGGFGARDFGAMISGQVLGPTLYKDPLKFQYDLGYFNSLPEADNFHRDLVGRAQLRLFKGLVVALNASHKFYQNDGLQTATIWGGDLKWEWEAFKLVLESAGGKNVSTDTQLWGAHATAAYEIPLPWWELRLTPALMGEVFNPDISSTQQSAYRLAGALNLDINKSLRVVLGLSKVWEPANAEVPPSSPTRLLLQTQLRF